MTSQFERLKFSEDTLPLNLIVPKFPVSAVAIRRHPTPFVEPVNRAGDTLPALLTILVVLKFHRPVEIQDTNNPESKAFIEFGRSYEDEFWAKDNRFERYKMC